MTIEQDFEMVGQPLRECDSPVFISGQTANGTWQTVDSEDCGECDQDKQRAALSRIKSDLNALKAENEALRGNLKGNPVLSTFDGIARLQAERDTLQEYEGKLHRQLGDLTRERDALQAKVE
jgi:hypothetical protein